MAELQKDIDRINDINA